MAKYQSSGVLLQFKRVFRWTGTRPPSTSHTAALTSSSSHLTNRSCFVSLCFSYLNIIFLWLFRSPCFYRNAGWNLAHGPTMDSWWVSFHFFYLANLLKDRFDDMSIDICRLGLLWSIMSECIKYKRQLSAQERVNPRLSSIYMINAYQTAF